jgi:Amino acid permease
VAQCPHHPDLDDRPADRDVLRHRRPDQARRGGAERAGDDPLPTGAPPLRVGGHVSLHPGATTAILLLAANIAYDFPRLLFLLARDRLAPELFLRIGDRLTFSNGIIVLSVAAAVIFLAFGGKTDLLIPLYAVGVFFAFTMSQAGMVVHWSRRRDDAHWRRSLLFNVWTVAHCLSAQHDEFDLVAAKS